MYKYKVLHIPSGECVIVEYEEITDFSNFFNATADIATNKLCWNFWEINRNTLCNEYRCIDNNCPWHDGYFKIEEEYLVEEINDQGQSSSYSNCYDYCI
jgi:hypothetical protein